MKKRVKNQERIDRIRAIHDEFMAELNKIKVNINEQSKKHIKSIENKKIDQILDKINKEL